MADADLDDIRAQRLAAMQAQGGGAGGGAQEEKFQRQEVVRLDSSSSLVFPPPKSVPFFKRNGGWRQLDRAPSSIWWS